MRLLLGLCCISVLAVFCHPGKHTPSLRHKKHALALEANLNRKPPGGGGGGGIAKAGEEEGEVEGEDGEYVEEGNVQKEPVKEEVDRAMAHEEDTEWKEESAGTKRLRRHVLYYAPWLTLEVRMFIYDCFFYGIIVTFFGKLGFMFFGLFREYGIVVEESGKQKMEDRTFTAYLQYRFAYWFAWYSGSRGVVLVVVTMTVLFGGAAVYNFFTGHSIVWGTWNCMVWLVAPDAGAGEPTIAGAIIGAIMSIGGLVIFALLLTLLQESFSSYLDTQANSLVVESSHTVLIGLSEHTMPIIQQLCIAHECHGGTTIVILSSSLSKEEMEEEISNADIDLMGSRVVVRTGQPWRKSDLEQVAADTAGTVVLMSDHSKEKEQRDASLLQCLVTLRSEGWPANGKIVVVCSLMRNLSLFQRIGGENTEVVLLGRFSAKLLVQCSAMQGLARAVGETLGFSGSELYIRDVPEHMYGLTFGEASVFYPNAVLTGYAYEEKGRTLVRFCPDQEYKLNAEEDLVLLAASATGADAEKKPLIDSMPPWLQKISKQAQKISKATEQNLGHIQQMAKKAIPFSKESAEADSALGQTNSPSMLEAVPPSPAWSDKIPKNQPETIFIVGWNEVMTYMMLELDVVVTPGTKVYVLAGKSKDEREEFMELCLKRSRQPLINITEIEHLEGAIGSRYALDEQTDVLKEATRIFILSDEDAEDYSHADMGTIATLLQIRDIFLEQKHPADIPIIPEILDPKNVRQCVSTRSLDFMNASGLPSQILAMIAYNPRIVNGLEEFLSEKGSVNFKIEELSTYCKDGEDIPEELNFLQAIALVDKGSNDVLLGWTVPYDQTETASNMAAAGNRGEFHRMMADWCKAVHPGQQAYEWSLNPGEKCTNRQWTKDDRLFVLSPLQDCCSRQVTAQ